MKIFDAHFHLIDYRFPIIENRGFYPSEFSLEDYQKATADFELVGGAVVSGSFQGFDQTYLKDGLDRLGKPYYGVANIPHSMSDEQLALLDAAGVCAVRFNLKRGGSETLAHLKELSNRLREQWGWHTELYVDSKDLKDLERILSQVGPFSIDHLGLSKEGLPELYTWVERGVRVKATGFGRVDFDPIEVMQKIHEINPEALMFGTDLPSTRAKVPFSYRDVQRIIDHFDASDQERILYSNALNWYAKGRN